MPCTPTFAGAGDGGLVPAASLLGGLAPLGGQPGASGTGGVLTPVGGHGGGFGGGGGGHSGGGSGGGGTPTTPPGDLTPVSPVAAVPEARTWTMLITGFAAVGGAMRHRRLVVA